MRVKTDATQGAIDQRLHVVPPPGRVGGDGREEALAALRRNRGELRRAVNKGLTLKFSPELRFVFDESFDRMDETLRMLARADVRRDLDGD